MIDNTKPTARADLLGIIAGALDSDDPIPMYHQIASVVRRAIAAGELPIGADLPSVRGAAARLGVHYHTVRHAWEALGREGVVSLRRGRPGRVVRAPSARGGWRASPGSVGMAARPSAWIATHSLRDGAALAEQVSAAWEVTATPWPLGGPPPPPGVILLVGDATAPPWPARDHETHSLGMVLDHGVLAAVRRAADLLGVDRVVVVGDSTGPFGDLRRQLPRIGLRATVWSEPGVPTDAARDGVVTLVLPGAAGPIPADARLDPGVLVLEPVLAPGPLARIAAASGWQPAGNDNGPPR